jgi:16S rRNA (guanine527-N7)-methyltransferase
MFQNPAMMEDVAKKIRCEIVRGTSALGITLSEMQIEQFIVYAALLVEWNIRMNLTRIPPEEIVPLHFLDSLATCLALDLHSAQSLIDIGTGAGFPGVPLKIVYPHLHIILLDSTQKRLVFLEEVIKRLGLRNSRTLHARAEDAGREDEHREAYDVAVARAVARMNILMEWMLPFVRPGGFALALKSAMVDHEVKESQQAIQQLGGSLERSISITIPGTNILRKIIVVKKERHTPSHYPRAGTQIKRKPL